MTLLLGGTKVEEIAAEVPQTEINFTMTLAFTGSSGFNRSAGAGSLSPDPTISGAQIAKIQVVNPDPDHYYLVLEIPGGGDVDPDMITSISIFNANSLFVNKATAAAFRGYGGGDNWYWPISSLPVDLPFFNYHANTYPVTIKYPTP